MFDDNLYVCGGIDTSKSLLNDVWYFSFVTCSWTQIETSSIFPGIMGHCILIIEDVLYLIGGITENTYRKCNTRNTISLISYNLSTKEIRDLSYSFRPTSFLPIDYSPNYSFISTGGRIQYYPVPCSRSSCSIYPSRIGFTLFGGLE